MPARTGEQTHRYELRGAHRDQILALGLRAHRVQQDCGRRSAAVARAISATNRFDRRTGIDRDTSHALEWRSPS
jgi:hypothetical protein